MSPMETNYLLNCAKVLAEVERLTAVANEKIKGRTFVVPRVIFADLGRAAGRWTYDATTGVNLIQFNSKLVEVHTDRILADTVPHEMAHLIHYALRPQDFRRGSRLGHGRYWQMLARLLGHQNPTRCWQVDDTTRTALNIKPPKRHEYKCQCGAVCSAGPKQHARIQRGFAGFRIKSCGHTLLASFYVGLKQA